jgi:multiple antibiotic resistance protein
MLETALLALTTFVATIGPIEAAFFFATLSQGRIRAERRRIAGKAVVIATVILLVFAVLGEPILKFLGVTLPALRASGGVLLLLIAVDMVFVRQSGGTAPTDSEQAEAQFKQDIAVFPLATPIIAGPGAMSSAVLLAASTEDDWARHAIVIAVLLAVMLATWLLLLAASRLQELIGLTARQVIDRVLGILLAALAMQFLLDGIAQSDVFR